MFCLERRVECLGTKLMKLSFGESCEVEGGGQGVKHLILFGIVFGGILLINYPCLLNLDVEDSLVVFSRTGSMAFLGLFLAMDRAVVFSLSFNFLFTIYMAPLVF